MSDNAKPASGCTVKVPVLPRWSALASRNPADMTALERYIYNNEPAGNEASVAWRRELEEAIQYIRQNASVSISGDERG